MKRRTIFGILFASLCFFLLTSCGEDEEGRRITGQKEYTLTVASRKLPGLYPEPSVDHVSQVFAVKEEGSDMWEIFPGISGFTYEEGYEYVIRIRETNYLDYSMGDPAWTEYDLLKLVSKEKKNSQNLPDNFIPDWFFDRCRFVSSEYEYIVEADDKETVEEDLKSNPVVTQNGLHCGLTHDLKQWLLVDNEKRVESYGSLVKENKEDIPDAYRSFPPEGQVQGFMQWNFMTGGDSGELRMQYDVFICLPAQGKSDAVPVSVPWLYQDLTAHYQEKYPEAGVTAVVVRRRGDRQDGVGAALFVPLRVVISK